MELGLSLVLKKRNNSVSFVILSLSLYLSMGVGYHNTCVARTKLVLVPCM
jgi:hypothetical protein